MSKLKQIFVSMNVSTSIPDDFITTNDLCTILRTLDNLDSREDPLYFIKKVGEKEQKYNIMNITFMKYGDFNWHIFYVNARINHEFFTQVQCTNRPNPENGKTDVLEMLEVLKTCGYHPIIGMKVGEKKVMFEDITNEDYKSMKEIITNLNNNDMKIQKSSKERFEWDK